MKMHRHVLSALSLICVTTTFVLAQPTAPTNPVGKQATASAAKPVPKANPLNAVPTTTPVKRDGERHQLINSRAKPGEVDLLFIGDSITAVWEKNGTAFARAAASAFR